MPTNLTYDFSIISIIIRFGLLNENLNYNNLLNAKAWVLAQAF